MGFIYFKRICPDGAWLVHLFFGYYGLSGMMEYFTVDMHIVNLCRGIVICLACLWYYIMKIFLASFLMFFASRACRFLV